MPFNSRVLGLCLATCSSSAAQAQTAMTLDAITISAAPLSQSSSAMASPADVLDGNQLMLRDEGTLGATLDGLPGVRADTFGAGASRPVIRGQTAPRVTVLSDGSQIMDASSVSPDHAVVAEPMLAERIEVMRGPATLLYGGGAIGGVVNVIDNKIPEAVPENGVEGFAQLRGTSGSKERAAAFGITAGEGNFAIHVEGMKRRAEEYRVPHWASSRLAGSQEDSATGSGGFSFIGDRGFMGLAYTRTDSKYGLVGHDHDYEACHSHGTHLHCGGHGHDDHDDHGHDDDHHDHDHDHVHDHGAPYVKLKSERVDLRGEYRQPFPGFSRLRLRAGLTDYEHREIEEGQVATTFKNRGFDARVEAEHEPIAGWRGVVGLQTSSSDFSALGVESFMPKTRTSATGGFLLEEYRLHDWRFEVGARQDWQSVSPDSVSPSRTFTGTSASASAAWNFLPGYSAALSLSRSQRLPGAQELYADGIHMATNTYELGDSGLGKETSQNIDLTFRKHEGDARFSLGLFHNRINNYIYARTLDRYEDFQLIQYSQADAQFTGVEGSADYRFSRYVTAGVFGDMVRGKLTGGGGNLPRIPGGRLGLRASTTLNRWGGSVELYRVLRQDRVADYESDTEGYNMLNAAITYDGKAAGMDYTVYLRGANLLNQLAYNHSSFVATASPLPGRRITLGVRVEY